MPEKSGFPSAVRGKPAVGAGWAAASVAAGAMGMGAFFRSYLLAILFWTGISVGCLAVLMLQHVTGGWWGLVIRRVLEAGTDAVLHCSGKMEEMVAVASAAGELGEAGRERLGRAMASVAGSVSYESAYAELAEKRDRLLALA